MLNNNPFIISLEEEKHKEEEIKNRKEKSRLDYLAHRKAFEVATIARQREQRRHRIRNEIRQLKLEFNEEW